MDTAAADVAAAASRFGWRHAQVVAVLVVSRLLRLGVYRAGGEDIAAFEREHAAFADDMVRVRDSIVAHNCWGVCAEDTPVQAAVRARAAHVADVLERVYAVPQDICARSVFPAALAQALETRDGWAAAEAGLISGRGCMHDAAAALGAGEHFAHVALHKQMVVRMFFELRAFVRDVQLVDAVFHDWSKYLLGLVPGYSVRWHLPRDAAVCEEVRAVLWGRAWRMHYTLESHHCEHFARGCAAGAGDMDRASLEESLLDKAAMRWMKELGGARLADIAEAVRVDARFLGSYTQSNLAVLVDTICRIDPCSEGRYAALLRTLPASAHAHE